MARKLDELFDAYERRKVQEQKAAEEKAARVAREREKATALLGVKVLGPLGPLMDKIRERGHVADVSQSLEGDHPQVVFLFAPKKLNAADPEPQPSRIKFTWTGHDFMETVQEIAGSASRGVAERWRIGEVTEEWTRTQVYHVVEAALKNQ